MEKRLNSNHLKLIAIIAMTVDHFTDITFTAGLNYDGSNKGVANATKYFIPEEWVNDRNKAYDWALFELDKSLGNVAGYVELKIEPLLINDYIEIYGYPRDSKELSGNTKYPNHK